VIASFPLSLSASVLALWALVSVAAADEPVVPADARVQKRGEGFRFVEGPAWDRKEAVYFSDVRTQTIHRWTEKEGVKIFKKLEGGCNGLRFDGEGNLLVCQPAGRRVLRISPDGKETVVADSYEKKKLNSPNDLWVAPNGGIYFTDPRYGSMDNLQQDGFHVYYLPPRGGQIRRVTSDLKKPNGVVGSADGKKLYVADPGANTTYVYTIQADGSLSDRQIAARSGSDGLTLDERGNLYITGRTIRIYSPKGTVVGQIPLPEVASNLTFGGADRRTLFITARTGFYAIKLNVRGGSDPFARK
jgi:gluconolactonase